jgi:hypothetical protein
MYSFHAFTTLCKFFHCGAFNIPLRKNGAQINITHEKHSERVGSESSWCVRQHCQQYDDSTKYTQFYAITAWEEFVLDIFRHTASLCSRNNWNVDGGNEERKKIRRKSSIAGILGYFFICFFMFYVTHFTRYCSI